MGSEQGQEVLQQVNQSARFSKFDMLEDQRFASFVKVVTALQKEGKLVEKSKSTLRSILNDASYSTGNSIPSA